ncbi:hypothetical protein TrLO_g743, partial [Triparma laevis f. longispina]
PTSKRSKRGWPAPVTVPRTKRKVKPPTHFDSLCTDAPKRPWGGSKARTFREVEEIAAPVISNGPFQNNYLPSEEEIEKMTSLELSQWRAEERKKRNRASAAASRLKNMPKK